MLWYKAWLELRWRFAFLAGSILILWLMPYWMPWIASAPVSRMWVGIQLEFVLLSIFAAIYMAGTGINTQTTYAATSGFHGSMLFTLSLPVSRWRLLAVRAGLGALMTGAAVILLAWHTLLHAPVSANGWQALACITRVLVCTMAVYAVSVLMACVLDEMWAFTGAVMVWSAVFMMQYRSDAVARLSPLRGLSLISYPVGAPMPWAMLAASLVLSGIFLGAALLVLKRKEY